MVKVIVLGTGSISSIAVRCMFDRSDFEVIGVWAHEETAGDKVGTDAGLLYGENPVGIMITGDLDQLMSLKPDCAVLGLNPPANKANEILLPLVEKLLTAGINVVGTSLANLVYPSSPTNQEITPRLTEAALKGNASLYISGIEPGFAADHLLALVLTCSNTIKQVRTQEIFMYDTYPDEMTIKYAFGFGMPMEYEPVMSGEGTQLVSWGPPIAYIADALGYKLDGYRQIYEKAITKKELHVASGTIPAGTVGAVRFETIGIVNGEDKIIIEHVNRMAKDLAPDWPQAPRDGTYRLIVEGDPNMSCEFFPGKNEITAGYEGMVITCMRCVNAIPYVVEAKAGVLDSTDLPLTLPKESFRSDLTDPVMKGYGDSK
ncbi:hypothetical protein [Enterococcus sp.]|uniref:NAD(P)H-dependent amine dehydrogenase family protein n=1 Tax=Enterococcus sp. TaxID=35783 RepID=UPI00290B79F6|nr:hypothetical protein [Enterococcus sp.]MDU5334346.1 hypothetical protein [Enterococcus sp.]